MIFYLIPFMVSKIDQADKIPKNRLKQNIKHEQACMYCQ